LEGETHKEVTRGGGRTGFEMTNLKEGREVRQKEKPEAFYQKKERVQDAGGKRFDGGSKGGPGGV